MYHGSESSNGHGGTNYDITIVPNFFPIISAVNSTNICVLVCFLLAAFHVHPFFLAYKFVQYLRGEKGMAHCLLSLWVLLAQVKMHCSLYYVL